MCGISKITVVSLPLFLCRSPKDVGDVIALSDITPSGAADHSQEPSPARLAQLQGHRGDVKYGGIQELLSTASARRTTTESHD